MARSPRKRYCACRATMASARSRKRQTYRDSASFKILTMPQPDENGFVKRGFYLLGAMTLLAAVVLSIIFLRPDPAGPVNFEALPANASEPGWRIRSNASIT